MSAWSDHVQPHGPLTPLLPGVWQVEGTMARNPLPRTMLVARLPDGRLWLHSVVALDEPTLAELTALGPVGWIVVPSGMHRLDAAVYAERFPEAQVLCPAAAQDKVAEVVAVHATCEAVLPALGFRLHQPDGLKADELIYELPLQGGGAALIFCDAVFHLPHQPGFGGFLLRVMGSSGFFGTTRVGRWFMGEVAPWAAWLRAQSERTDVRLLSMAHGDPITEDCARHLREAADRLG